MALSSAKLSTAAVTQKLNAKKTEAANEVLEVKEDDVQFQRVDSATALAEEVAALEQRNAAIKELAQDVAAVGEMFKDLKELVDEQQPKIDKIETNIKSANKQAKEGLVELMKAEGFVKTRSKCFC